MQFSGEDQKQPNVYSSLDATTDFKAPGCQCPESPGMTYRWEISGAPETMSM